MKNEFLVPNSEQTSQRAGSRASGEGSREEDAESGPQAGRARLERLIGWRQRPSTHPPHLLTDGHQVGAVSEHGRVVQGAAGGTHQTRPDTAGAAPGEGGPPPPLVRTAQAQGLCPWAHAQRKPQAPERNRGRGPGGRTCSHTLDASPPGQGLLVTKQRGEGAYTGEVAACPVDRGAERGFRLKTGS